MHALAIVTLRFEIQIADRYLAGKGPKRVCYSAVSTFTAMSRSKHAEADDVWTKLQRNPPNRASDGTTANSGGDSDAGTNGSSLVFVGDLNSGKSTLIQTFLKPTAAKDTKPTIALEYNFARRTVNGIKQVANLWEIGGDLVEPKLMEIGITLASLPTTAVIICCDLSKPHNILNSVLRGIGAVKETTGKRVAALQATNVNRLNEIRDKLAAPYKEHPDVNRVRPLDVPVCIVANKHDTLKSLSSSDRRAVIQVLRFVAHFFGAHLIATSSTDAAHRDAFRALISSLAFGMPIKAACEVNPDKVVYVTRGSDSYQKIFLEHGAAGAEGDAPTKSKGLVANEAEMANYVTHKGVTRDCWAKVSQYMQSLFGEPDKDSDKRKEGKDGLESGEDGNEAADLNPFPETEIDDMRAVRDAALARYIQEAERKEEMLNKMNQRSSN